MVSDRPSCWQTWQGWVSVGAIAAVLAVVVALVAWWFPQAPAGSTATPTSLSQPDVSSYPSPPTTTSTAYSLPPGELGKQSPRLGEDLPNVSGNSDFELIRGVQSQRHGGPSGTTNGQVFSFALMAWIDFNNDYTLARKYKTFHTVVGLDDNAPPGSRLQVNVYLDDRRAYSKPVGLGEALDIALDVSSTYRIRLETVHLAGPDNSIVTIWGEPTVSQ